MTDVALALWTRVILIIILVTLDVSFALGASRQSDYQTSLAELAHIVGLEIDSDSLNIVHQFFGLIPYPDLLSAEIKSD